MKKLHVIFMVVVMLGLATTVSAQDKKPVTVSFKVYGNCGMCKKRIEAALDVKGVRNAEWNVETKMIQVVYVPAKISPEEIHRLIAASGHDTDKVKAPDEVYKELPECCLYREHPNTHQE